MLRSAFLLFGIATALAAADPEPPSPARGKQLFVTCAGCHNIDSDARKMGPSLRSLFGRVTLRNGKRADDANVREILLDGFNGMPSFRYSFRPAEIEDLMAFLHTLSTPVKTENAEAGGETLFRSFCQRCHRNGLPETPTGEQMKQVEEGHHGAPAMRDWMDKAQLESLMDYLRKK